MAMAAALRRLSCSSSRMQPFLWSSLCYMSSLTSESVCEKKKSRVTKRLNTPLEVVDPEIADIHELENARPWEGVEHIPSESFTSVSVNQAVGSIMINKYREAYPGARYYGLIEFIDTLGTLWQNRALAMFRLDPEKWGVIVQSVPEELAKFQLYSALLKPHKRIMALDVDRPYPSQCQTDTKKIFAVSIFFETMPYRLDESTGYVDSNQLEKSAALFRPKLIVTRTQAYDSVHEYAHLRKVCDKHEAILLADMARFGGLVAVGYVPSPFKYADIVTAIDDKTLRGPRGPMIFFRKGVKKIKKQGKQGKEVLYDFEDKINEAVFPGLQDVALKQGTTPEYKAFQEQVLSNCARFAQILVSKGYEIVSCGSENDLVLVNVKNKGIDAFRVKMVLTYVNILADERTVPGDVSATDPGGIVMGTLALTSRGFIEEDFTEVANFFDSAVNLALKIKAVTEEHRGKKFLHFERAIYYDTEIRAEIKQLRHDINQYAKQFASIGFGKETLTYKL